MTLNEKERLRAEYKLLRGTLKSKERDEAIYKSFVLSPFFQCNSFFVYRSVGTEADTFQIIKTLRAADKQVLLPRIQSGKMLAVPYCEDLERVHGIPQPKAGEDCAAEVILTPLLAFDEEGYRLGYGGGYYDRYFACHGGKRVGLAYHGQAAALIHEAHDIRLEAIITEKGVQYFT